MRNFGARGVTGIRGAYERLIKVGYGLSILGTVPLVVLPFQAALGPIVSAWTPAWPRGAGKKMDVISDGTGRGSYLQEQFIATLVLGIIAVNILKCELKLRHVFTKCYEATLHMLLSLVMLNMLL